MTSGENAKKSPESAAATKFDVSRVAKRVMASVVMTGPTTNQVSNLASGPKTAVMGKDTSPSPRYPVFASKFVPCGKNIDRQNQIA